MSVVTFCGHDKQEATEGGIHFDSWFVGIGPLGKEGHGSESVAVFADQKSKRVRPVVWCLRNPHHTHVTYFLREGLASQRIYKLPK